MGDAEHRADLAVEQLLSCFLSARHPAESVRVDGLARVSSGRSRENWLFDAVTTGPDGDERPEPLIVRRDPLGGLLETDRATEFAVLQALAGTDVPTPVARWLDATGEELGRPSLVMRRAPGECDYFVVNGDLPLAARVDLAERFCDLLASVHAVDWRACGLGELFDDPGVDAARHEVDAWEAGSCAATSASLCPSWPWPPPGCGSAPPARPARCSSTATSSRATCCWPGGEPTALLDWELAHLGDPMEDLGWVTQPLRQDEHLIPGAWERADLFARYRAATGRDVDEAGVAWWNVFACYKTAVMQVSGLRAFLEGRSPELYRPTHAVLAALLEAAGG